MLHLILQFIPAFFLDLVQLAAIMKELTQPSKIEAIHSLLTYETQSRLCGCWEAGRVKVFLDGQGCTFRFRVFLAGAGSPWPAL
jgi:hypothetical protein